MSALVKQNIDKDLMILDESIGECTIPERDWESIINIWHQSGNKFPIPALICANIIVRIKKGLLPKIIFKEYGISYANFENRYNKNKSIIEELTTKDNLSDDEYNIIQTLRNDPVFILGRDIDRARAFHLNKSVEKLDELSEANAMTWLAYMKEIHKEEFTSKEDKKGVEVVIQIGQGLLEAI